MNPWVSSIIFLSFILICAKDKILALFCILLFIAENTYFGWNLHPSCTGEEVCDLFVLIVGIFALFHEPKTKEN
jgi:hypothetical protein